MERPLPNLKLSTQSLLDIESLSTQEILTLLELGNYYAENKPSPKTGQGRILMNLFFETSTRTKLSFEVSSQRLGFTSINFDPATSAMFKKGETLIDTIQTLNALGPDIAVIRHGTAESTKKLAGLFECPVLNAGDGLHAHPTQALLDALTIQRKKGPIQGLNILICGDILHSRVAKSNIELLTRLGAHISVMGPASLLPDNIDNMDVKIFHDFDQALEGQDVVMMLRIQKERMEEHNIPENKAYHKLYGLTAERLARANKGAILMHPGPVNRDIEVSSDVLDNSKQSVINYQVKMGVAMRMAILDLLTR